MAVVTLASVLQSNEALVRLKRAYARSAMNDALVIDRRGRLVHDDDFRAFEERSRKHHELPLA